MTSASLRKGSPRSGKLPPEERVEKASRGLLQVALPSGPAVDGTWRMLFSLL